MSKTRYISSNLRVGGVRMKQIRRRVRRVQLEPNLFGDYLFVSKSMTRAKGPTHYCTVNVQTGQVFCSCEHFTYTAGRSKFFITGEGHCKHLRKAIATVNQILKTSK